jgi:crotonobetainyl-CoA:carnitine CoA-transferase CaiB-like acyl-CoA transferase
LYPLTGVKVLELCEGLCGPLAASRLGDAGADVVKIESPSGDPARRFGPPFLNGHAAVFLAVNRNKRSCQVDLESPAAQPILDQLIRWADVIIEDLGPSTMDRIGLNYEALSARNPSMIMCSISAFGENGPLTGHPGSELVIQCVADVPNTLGVAGAEPVRLGIDSAAVNTAIFASQAVAGALFHRMRGGGSQHVFVDMVGSMLHTRGTLLATTSELDDWEALLQGVSSLLLGYLDPPDTAYRTKDGRVYFILRHVTAESFDKLMLELDLAECILDPRFARHGRDAAPPMGAGPHMASTRETWESGFSQFTASEVRDMMLDAGADSVLFNDVSAALREPQVEASELVIELRHPDYGTYRDIRPAWRFSGTSMEVRRPAPTLGEHTEEVLAELGLSEINTS